MPRQCRVNFDTLLSGKKTSDVSGKHHRDHERSFAWDPVGRAPGAPPQPPGQSDPVMQAPRRDLSKWSPSPPPYFFASRAHRGRPSRSSLADPGCHRRAGGGHRTHGFMRGAAGILGPHPQRSHLPGGIIFDAQSSSPQGKLSTSGESRQF